MHKIILSKLIFAVKIRKTNMSLNSMKRKSDQFFCLEMQLPLWSQDFLLLHLISSCAYYNKDNKVKGKGVEAERE